MSNREPDEVTLGNCCPDEIVDPHLPERHEAVAIARRVYGAPPKVPVRWHATMTVQKYRGAPAGDPYEVITSEPNLLLNAGIDFILNRIISTAGTSFSAANARICVGNGTTTPAAGDTDLAGASKLRKAMDATFPSITSHVLSFVSTFATTDANFAWAEWGVANDATAGVLLNRAVQAFGTKTVADTWVATVTCTLTG